VAIAPSSITALAVNADDVGGMFAERVLSRCVEALFCYQPQGLCPAEAAQRSLAVIP
jgi:hypothetical protein